MYRLCQAYEVLPESERNGRFNFLVWVPEAQAIGGNEIRVKIENEELDVHIMTVLGIRVNSGTLPYVLMDPIPQIMCKCEHVKGTSCVKTTKV